jgi:hypothetical protein
MESACKLAQSSGLELFRKLSTQFGGIFKMLFKRLPRLNRMVCKAVSAVFLHDYSKKMPPVTGAFVRYI